MTLLLRRFTVRPRHLDAYLPLWREEVALRERHGYVTHRAFVETDAEPKLSWLLSHEDPAAGAAALGADPATIALAERAAPHVFRNLVERPVRPELLPGPGEPGGPGEAVRTVVMRRYAITGSWAEFLEVWRRIVLVRERHGFPCLFAVADEPHDMFTWAFGMDADWADLRAAQRGYYEDPARVALRGVFDYMADYDLHPAHELDPRG